MSVNAEGAKFVRAAERASLSPQQGTIVRAGHHEVALFLVDGEVRAYENACPHQGGPVGEGLIEGSTVTCPWHAWCFDLRTGNMTLGDFARLRRFDSYVEGGAVYVATEPDPDV